MTKEKYLKRLNKCSKQSIAHYLHVRDRNDSMLREIELIEYNIQSKALLDEMDKFNKASSEIEVVDVKSKMLYLRLHKKWEEAYEKHEKLVKWFSSKDLEVSE